MSFWHFATQGSPRTPHMTLTNTQIVAELLVALPPGFYGSVELSFVKGPIMQSKTTTSRKYNPEAKSPESYDARSCQPLP